MQTNSNNAVKPPAGIWLRGIYMLLFAFLLGVAKVVIFSLVILQFFMVLLMGSPNAQLLLFGHGLSCYIYQIMLFLTFNSDEHPYPFSEWPSQ